jgi:Leucine-rich repeat (LRR) protein
MKFKKKLGGNFKILNKYNPKKWWNPFAQSVYNYSEFLKLKTEEEFNNVIELRFSNQRINKLPESILNCKNLKILYCQNNNITELPELGNLKFLKLINCSNNKLTKLPESIGDLHYLKSLICINNKLTELSESIGYCISLESLFCQNNELTKLPLFLGALINLKTLDCKNNKLTELSESIGDCNSLKFLNCSYNELIFLDNSIIDLKKITFLNCSNNKLTKLPNYFEEIKTLEILDCSNNNLTELPEDLLNMKHLDCSNNKLTKLPTSMSENLDFLDCSNNLIRELPISHSYYNIRVFNGDNNAERLTMQRDVNNDDKVDSFQVHTAYKVILGREDKYIEILDSFIKNPQPINNFNTSIQMQRTFTSNKKNNNQSEINEQNKLLKMFDTVWNNVLETYLNDDKRSINLVAKTIQYINQQDSDFKQLYNENFINDCYFAYTGSASCATGTIERVILCLQNIVGVNCPGGDCENLEFRKLYFFFADQLDFFDVLKEWHTKYTQTEEGKMEMNHLTKEQRKQNCIKFIKEKYKEKNSLTGEILKIIDYEINRIDYIFETNELALGGSIKQSKTQKRKKVKKITKNNKRTTKKN